jgi:autotransporter-associated beta strand protein
MLLLTAGAAATLGSPTAFGQTYTWIGSTGNFNDPTKWQNATMPVSDPGTSLVFTAGNDAAITAINNIGSPFQVNSLAFSVNNAFSLRSSPTSFLFQLAGASPSITMNGLGSATMFAGGGIRLTSDLNISIAGPGSLNLNDVISDDGFQRAVTISGSNPVRAWGLVSLGAANTFAGGLTLDGAALTTTQANATTFGANGRTLTVTANGAMIAPLGSMNPSISTLQLDGPLYLEGTVNLTLAGLTNAPTVVQGSGTLHMDFGGAGLTINSDSSAYTGAVVIDQSPLPNMGTLLTGTLTLGGIPNQLSSPNGSLHGVPSFDVRAGGLLLLNNSAANSVQNNDRIADTTPVRLRSGGIQLNGPVISAVAPTDLTEQIGTLSGAGYCTLTIFPSASTNVVTTLEADSLVRVERGTFNFRGTALGDGATATRGRITLTNPLAAGALVGGGGPAGSAFISILPYAVGGNSNTDFGTSLVTYGADGFRALTNSEYYSTDLAPSDHTSNVRREGPTVNNAAGTMNALVLANDGGSSDASVTGTGTLTITSGALIVNPHNAITSISNNIAFGAAEAVISTPGINGVRITGNLTGSNGLTKSGNATTSGTQTNDIVLTGDNSGLTGPLTINGGVLQFNSAQALPGTGAIVANGTNILAVGQTTAPAAGLFYAGAGPLTLSRAINVNTGYLTLKQWDGTGGQPTIGNLTIAGQISGVGAVNYYAQNSAVTNPGEIFVTNTGSTYAGPTRFSSGTTHIAGDGCTGVGGGWDFAYGAALTLEGDVANRRHVNLEGALTINTNGHNLTLDGPITNLLAGGMSPSTVSGFTKNGAGTMTLTSPINFLNGAVTVNAGSLIVNGNLGPSPTNALTIAAGATLSGSGTIWRNTTVSGTLAPGNSPGILTVGGSLMLSAGATMSVEVYGAIAGSGYDQVVVNSANGAGTAVNLGAAYLNVLLGYQADASSMFWLIVNNNGATSGYFVGLPEGATVSLGTVAGRTYTGTISYNGNAATGLADHSGNDVVIYNIDWSPRCGSADFNCDGDTGTDADIEAFFACLAGSCPPAPCTSSADFDGDGDVGTDADIEAFFRVLAGGPC